jgi:hypothetical protein
VAAHPIRPIPSEKPRSNSQPDNSQPHPSEADAITIGSFDLDRLITIFETCWKDTYECPSSKNQSPPLNLFALLVER